MRPGHTGFLKGVCLPGSYDWVRTHCAVASSPHPPFWTTLLNCLYHCVGQGGTLQTGAAPGGHFSCSLLGSSCMLFVVLTSYFSKLLRCWGTVDCVYRTYAEYRDLKNKILH